MGKFSLFGNINVLKPAPNPSEIIWENCYIKRKHIGFREKLITIIIIAFMALIFFLTYQIQWWSTATMDIFPGVDCQLVEATFGPSIE